MDRPWITPQEIRDYTEYESVKERSDIKLKMDIARAETYVISYTNNDFKDVGVIPSSVKNAVILLAEMYAYNAYVATKDIKSETLDDYSYTVETHSISVDTLDIKPLLDDYVIVKSRNGVTMKLRKL